MENFKSHDVYELVPRTNGMRTHKLGLEVQNGIFERNKGRLVARGNYQCPGIDYGESFSPVMRLKSFLLYQRFATSTSSGSTSLRLTHTGRSRRFTWSNQTVTSLLGRKIGRGALKKGLYGLVKAGRTWNEEPNAHMQSDGFTGTPKDPAMYVKNSWTDRDFAAAGFWVDNCVAIDSRKELTALVESVNAKYGVPSLGEVRWVLGMLQERDRPAPTISISQEAFTNSIFARFNLTGASLSRRPSPQELPFPWMTVLFRRTKLRR